jgi:hypothetical protein
MTISKLEIIIYVSAAVAWGIATAVQGSLVERIPGILALLSFFVLLIFLFRYLRKKCPQCKNANFLGPNFCGYCGHKLYEDKIEV